VSFEHAKASIGQHAGSQTANSQLVVHHQDNALGERSTSGAHRS
jgi:hypothetical protein